MAFIQATLPCDSDKRFSERLEKLKSLIRNDERLLEKALKTDNTNGCDKSSFADWEACQTY